SDYKSLKYFFDYKDFNMRQRRLMEFLKDYDFKLSYYSGKLNIVSDVLSRKSLGIFLTMIKEEEMISVFESLKLGIREIKLYFSITYYIQTD
ncbi:hypothetical protein DF186_15505, partial [Enterococcus hirae]